MHSSKDLAVSPQRLLDYASNFSEAPMFLSSHGISVRTSRLAACGNYPLLAANFVCSKKNISILSRQNRRVSGLSSLPALHLCHNRLVAVSQQVILKPCLNKTLVFCVTNAYANEVLGRVMIRSVLEKNKKPFYYSTKIRF